MCNLYSVVTNREAMRRIAKAMSDTLGNFPELPGVYPDYFAPIVRLDAHGQREIVLARWGMPSLKDAPSEKPILASEEDRETWLTAPWSEARKLQRPTADGELEIVHRTALKYLPGVKGIPSGDPLRVSNASPTSTR